MSELNKVIESLNKMFSEEQYSNASVLNALSIMSVHLAFVFGIPKETYIKDLSIMFDERVQKAIDQSKEAA